MLDIARFKMLPSQAHRRGTFSTTHKSMHHRPRNRSWFNLLLALSIKKCSGFGIRLICLHSKYHQSVFGKYGVPAEQRRVASSSWMYTRWSFDAGIGSFDYWLGFWMRDWSSAAPWSSAAIAGVQRSCKMCVLESSKLDTDWHFQINHRVVPFVKEKHEVT